MQFLVKSAIMSTNISAPAEAPVLHFGFLLVPNFTLLAFSSAIEPLRMANHLSGKTLYRWSVITELGETVQASDGMRIEADFSLAEHEKFDTVYVCGGIDVEQGDYKNILRWLNRQALAKVNLGGICTGSYLLAAAGLLDGYTCTIHWE
jgi:transcriptional regulator GlxA family with amidase domain